MWYKVDIAKVENSGDNAENKALLRLVNADRCECAFESLEVFYVAYTRIFYWWQWSLVPNLSGVGRRAEVLTSTVLEILKKF